MDAFSLDCRFIRAGGAPGRRSAVLGFLPSSWVHHGFPSSTMYPNFKRGNRLQVHQHRGQPTDLTGDRRFRAGEGPTAESTLRPDKLSDWLRHLFPADSSWGGSPQEECSLSSSSGST